MIELRKGTFEVAKVNNGLNIKPGFVLIKFGTKDLRGTSPTEFQEMFDKINPGNRIEMWFLSSNAPMEYQDSNTELPNPGTIIVYCSSCDENFLITKAGQFRPKRRHLNQCTPKSAEVKHICFHCNKVFDRLERLEQHCHVRWSKLDVQYQDYLWVGEKSEVKDIAQEDNRMIDIAISHKFSIPGIFPGLMVPYQLKKDQALKSHFEIYGNSSGVSYYKKILKERRELGVLNPSLILHKNVRVKDDRGNILAWFPEEITKPAKDCKSLIVTEVDEDRFEIKLRETQKQLPSWMKHQPMEDSDIDILQKYKKKNGMRFALHRWPGVTTRKYNLFRSVHKMDEGAIIDYTGLSTENFWNLCSEMSTTQLTDLLAQEKKSISLPSAILLYRYVFSK